MTGYRDARSSPNMLNKDTELKRCIGLTVQLWSLENRPLKLDIEGRARWIAQIEAKLR
jgi:hypothetical protein